MPLFTANMTTRLVELIADNYVCIFPNSRRKNADANRETAWNMMAMSMNREFRTNPTTVKQLDDTWKS
jgi:hypothetical protein